VAVWGAGYHIPLYQQGDSVDLYASYSNVDSGTITAGVFDLAVSGKGAVYGARYNQQLSKQGELDGRIAYGVDIKAYKNSVLFAGNNLANDVTLRPLSVTWMGTLPLGVAELNLSLGLVHNLAGGSRGSQADFERTRSDAKADYNIVRVSAAYARPVLQNWQLRLLLNGQMSADALVPGEQFGAGGASTVRGLDERAVSTDSGLLGNLELYSPNLCSANPRWQCRALAFHDRAYATRNHILPGELSSTAVASVGVGMRLAFANTANLQLDYGHVVQAGATTGSRNKLHFRMGFAY
jgi:hemolysin activation/secretion protein